MTWQTLRDFIDTRWAGLVPTYTGSIRTVAKDGVVTAIARGIFDEGFGSSSNVHSEVFTFTPAVIAANDTPVVDTTGDPGGLYLARWGAPANLFEIDGSNRIHTRITAASGTSDFYGTTQSGPGVWSTLHIYRLPQSPSSTLILQCRTTWTGHTNIPLPGVPSVSSGIVIAGFTPGYPTLTTSTASSCALVLDRNGGFGAQFYRGISTRRGTAVEFGRTNVPDIWFTGGTDLRLIVTPSGRITAQVKQSAGLWTNVSGSFQEPGFVPSAFAFFTGWFNVAAIAGNVDTYHSDLSLTIS